MRRVDWSDVPIPLLGRDDIGPGRLGLAEQNSGRVVFEDFWAGSPEKSLLKNSDSPDLIGHLTDQPNSFLKLMAYTANRSIYSIVSTNMQAARSNNFNFLRLMFSILVILSHSAELLNGNKNNELLTKLFNTITFGGLAVDGFFMLSGYLIVQSWDLRPNITKFLRNRMLRIYPGFIIAYILCVFIVGPFASTAINNQFTLTYYLNIDWFVFFRNMAFFGGPHSPYPTFTGCNYTALNGSVWTIKFEFSCYLFALVSGIFGFIRHRNRWLMTTLLFTLIFLCSKIEQQFNLTGQHITVNYPIIKLMMFFGIGGCYYLYREEMKMLKNYKLLLLITVILSLYSAIFSEISLALAGGALIFMFAQANIVAIKFFQTAPDVSYGVYLYAWPIQMLLIYYIPGITILQVFFIATVCCLILGYLSWTLVEKPCLNLKKYFH